MYTGPKLKSEDLKFGYDTGYGVLSNHVTSRFYPGEPTVNYTTDTPTGGGWLGTHSVIDSDTKTFKFSVTNFTANPGAGWRSFTWDMTSHAGSAVTISATFEYAGPVGQMAWVMIGQTNTGSGNSSGAGQYLGYSASSERYQKTTETKERISWSGTIGSGGSANQPSGHIGITVWINNGVAAGYGNYDSYIVMSDIQIEKKAHATPFVNGTRSSTQGLIDLKRTTSIDVSNASFDSTGQLEFDGTDDEIQLASNDWNKVNTVTVEAVVLIKGTPIDGNSYHVVAQKDGAYSGGAVYGIRIGSNNIPYGTFSKGTSSAETHVDTVSGTAMTANKYYHLVYTRRVGESVFYQNGEGINSATGSNDAILNNTSTVTIGQGDGRQLYGNIPVLKIYDVVLSAAEIKQNYNAYKNRFNI